MGKEFLICAALLVSSIPGALAAAGAEKVDLVTEYILKENYPEVFGDTHYRMQVQHIFVTDIDNNGEEDVVVHTKPHFRQSPTILFFEVNGDTVRQINEGLAPGPLKPLSGEFLDSHTTGSGVDLSVTDPTPATVAEFARVAREHFGGIVIYRDFLHVDGRSGQNVIIDMSEQDVPQNGVNCEDFEFSTPGHVTSGKYQPDGLIHLLAVVDGRTYIYRIHSFTKDGLIKKDVVVHPLPDDFQEVSSLPGEVFRYRDRQGNEHELF